MVLSGITDLLNIPCSEKMWEIVFCIRRVVYACKLTAASKLQDCFTPKHFGMSKFGPENQETESFVSCLYAMKIKDWWLCNLHH